MLRRHEKVMVGQMDDSVVNYATANQRKDIDVNLYNAVDYPTLYQIQLSPMDDTDAVKFKVNSCILSCQSIKDGLLCDSKHWKV